MIVITSLNESERYVEARDLFTLTITDNMGSKVLVSEEVTETKTINFMASYRFALEDGTCPGFHLCGIFGNKNELPKEMREAVKLEDLTEEQRANFIRTVGVKVHK